MSEPYWSALGARAGAGVVDYEGVWAAGTAYVPGDVVRHDGVDYLAVNPSTGVNPGAATGLELPAPPPSPHYPLDSETEASTDPLNDEFDVPGGMAGKWTLVGTTPTLVDVGNVTRDHAYLYRSDADAMLTAYHQAIGALPAYFYARVSASNYAANYARAGGIILLPASPTVGSPAYYFGQVFTGVRISDGIYYSSLGGFGGHLFQVNTPETRESWVRVYMPDATHATVDTSENGYYWTRRVTNQLLNFTVARVGIGFSPEGQGNVMTAFDYFRALRA